MKTNKSQQINLNKLFLDLLVTCCEISEESLLTGDCIKGKKKKKKRKMILELFGKLKTRRQFKEHVTN
ncbi:hypothetical protein HNY73_000841 [Argiope bruennichi]|uniref:Uncharacterized protein n=1 Tax=Argiope bruennichi TaxID=94029 RepID=A0A8T0FZK2_ARGBR|nr:hypothetical protein HNY73_000841 [Argiope bruennichi]